MTNMPVKTKLTSGLTTEADFQSAIGDFYDVVNQLGVIGPVEVNQCNGSGTITPTKCNVRVDTESLTPADTLNLIVPTNVGEKLLFLRSVSSGRVVTVKHNASGTGKIFLTGLVDVNLTNPLHCIALMWDESEARWNEMWRNFGLIVPAGSEASIRTALGLGTASTRNTGISAGQIPLIDNLGTAAFVNTGVGSGQVPLANQLGALAFKSLITDAEIAGSGVTPGTYSTVVVNAQGRVTGGGIAQAPIIRNYTANAVWTKPASLKYVDVFLTGAGGGSGGVPEGSNGANGGNTSFGAFASVGGGKGGLKWDGTAGSDGGAGGSAVTSIAGVSYLYGIVGTDGGDRVSNSAYPAQGVANPIPPYYSPGSYGRGAAGIYQGGNAFYNTPGGPGGGGMSGFFRIPASLLTDTVNLTVGVVGANGSAGTPGSHIFSAGSNGYIRVIEYY